MELICLALTIYYWIILARLILSWIQPPPEGLRPVYQFLYAATEPVLRVARPLIPPIRLGGGALDLSPLLVFFGIIVLQRLICR